MTIFRSSWSGPGTGLLYQIMETEEDLKNERNNKRQFLRHPLPI